MRNTVRQYSGLTAACTGHYEKWTIDMLSRFRSPKQKKAIFERIRNGSLDVIIGTHALLGKEIEFQRLGLLVIDEEHRFGVRHKEAIKAMRSEVDVLTLTATPIPRTLGMALEGLRDLRMPLEHAPDRGLLQDLFRLVEIDIDARGDR